MPTRSQPLEIPFPRLARQREIAARIARAAEAAGVPVVVPIDPRTRAAMYLRMSTDHQQFSVANQQDSIEQYAQLHGLQIVRTYTDKGCSGLSVNGREALQAMLDDVESKRADYRTILVYDVSRWGRFQDCDESAYYEHQCRRKGVHVIYCMEPFRNDASPVSAVIKSLKRIMAGEFSRELSQKVFAGKCRLARMGFSPGSPAVYGLRRLVVDSHGRHRGVLEHGERKCVQTDRVVMGLGPPRELKVLRWIFEQVANRRAKATQIMRALNAQGLRTPGGKLWTGPAIMGLISNQRYIGRLLFNRTSTKLKTPKVRNPSAEWICVNDAYPSAVDPKLFWKAQAAMAGWSTRITDEHALQMLKRLFTRRGTLTQQLIDATPGMPGAAFYAHRFGGLFGAYRLVGYTGCRDGRYVAGNSRRLGMAADWRTDVIRVLCERGLSIVRETRPTVLINGHLRIAVMLAWASVLGPNPQWSVQVHQRPQPDWVLIARLGVTGEAIQDYWLVRGGVWHVRIGVRSRVRRERYTAATPGPLLERLCELAKPSSIVAGEMSVDPHAAGMSKVRS